MHPSKRWVLEREGQGPRVTVVVILLHLSIFNRKNYHPLNYNFFFILNSLSFLKNYNLHFE